MFGASTPVIWRRCTSDTRPCGYRMKTSTASSPRKASMAAAPVSPEVAPTTVVRRPRRPSTSCIMRPSSCIATSLKASVGPWKISSRNRPASSWLTGTTAGWRKVPQAPSAMARSVPGAKHSPVNGAIRRSATSA